MATTHLEWLKAFEYQEVPLDSTGTTSLGIPERRFFPAHLYLVITSAPSVLGLCAISVGTNASSYNNLLPISLVSGLLAGSDIGREVPMPAHPVIPQDTEIFVNVTTAATGGGILHVIVSGWWFDYDVDGFIA